MLINSSCNNAININQNKDEPSVIIKNLSENRKNIDFDSILINRVKTKDSYIAPVLSASDELERFLEEPLIDFKWPQMVGTN